MPLKFGFKLDVRMHFMLPRLCSVKTRSGHHCKIYSTFRVLCSSFLIVLIQLNLLFSRISLLAKITGFARNNKEMTFFSTMANVVVLDPNFRLLDPFKLSFM